MRNAQHRGGRCFAHIVSCALPPRVVKDIIVMNDVFLCGFLENFIKILDTRIIIPAYEADSSVFFCISGPLHRAESVDADGAMFVDNTIPVNLLHTLVSEYMRVNMLGTYTMHPIFVIEKLVCILVNLQ